MSTARFAAICTAVVLLLFALFALGLGIVAITVLGGMVGILKAHRGLYFQHVRKSVFAFAAYAFSVVMMIWTTLSLVPGIERLFPAGVRLPDPLPASYWIHFALGSTFLLASLRPSNPNAVPLSFTGSVLREQACIIAQAPQIAWGSLRHSIVLVTEAHWLKGLGGLVLLILSVPVSFVALTAGALAVYWFAVLWAGFSALLAIPLWITHKLVFRNSLEMACPGCSRQHLISGPGPTGFFLIRCLCGQTMSTWRRAEASSADRDQKSIPWRQRQPQPGTLPLLVLGIMLGVLMAFRAFGVWDGSIKSGPWTRATKAGSIPANENSTTSEAPQGHRSVPAAKAGIW